MNFTTASEITHGPVMGYFGCCVVCRVVKFIVLDKYYSIVTRNCYKINIEFKLLFLMNIYKSKES